MPAPHNRLVQEAPRPVSTYMGSIPSFEMTQGKITRGEKNTLSSEHNRRCLDDWGAFAFALALAHHAHAARGLGGAPLALPGAALPLP